MQRASKTRSTASPVAPISIIRPAWESYTKLKSLGAGSGGQVYLVRGVPSKGGVPGSHVVKRMFLHNKEQELRQAANEIHLLRILKHPNMVDYVDDFFDDEGYLNIVMEYCEAGDLAQYIHDLRENGTKLTLSQVIYYAFQLITGVHYLHSVNILHRDLKPNNIFLTEESTSSERTLRLKIADFGISRTLSPDALAETVVGTPHYLSPEVCESAPYTNKADIWSLGVVLYELAAQQKPFEGTNLLAVVRKITSGRYTPLSGEYEPIQSVLSKMLVVDPAARASAQELECYFFTSGFVPRARADGGIKKNEGQNGGASCRILGAQPAPNVAVTPPKLSSPDDTEYDDHSFEEEDEAQYGDDFC